MFTKISEIDDLKKKLVKLEEQLAQVVKERDQLANEIGPFKTLAKILCNPDNADINLISNDSIKVPALRSLLKHFSCYFNEHLPMIDERLEIPIHDFNAQTLQTAMNFIRSDPVDLSQEGLYDFACMYQVDELKVRICIYISPFET